MSILLVLERKAGIGDESRDDWNICCCIRIILLGTENLFLI